MSRAHCQWRSMQRAQGWRLLIAVTRRCRLALATALVVVELLLQAGRASAAELASGVAQIASPGLMPPFIDLLTSTPMATLLLALGLLLLVADALFGGLGWLSVAGVGLLALFLWGHWQLGLVGWEGLALMALGLALLAVEALLLPGVSVAGVLGVGALLWGVALSVSGDELTQDTLTRLGWMLLGVLLVLSGGLLLLVRALPESRLLRGVVLRARVGAPDEGHSPGPLLRWLGGERLEALRVPTSTATERLSLVGAAGHATTPLRPVGIAELGGRRHEVIADGRYIETGTPVEVVSDDGARIVVRRTADDERSRE